MRHAQRKSRQYDDLPRRKSATVTRARFYVSTFLRSCDPLVLVAAPAPAASRPRPPSSTDQFLRCSLFLAPCRRSRQRRRYSFVGLRRDATRRDDLLRRYRLIFVFRSTDRTDSEFTVARAQPGNAEGKKSGSAEEEIGERRGTV